MTAASDRLIALRARLSAEGLDGLVVPSSDEHQNESVVMLGVRVKTRAFLH